MEHGYKKKHDIQLSCMKDGCKGKIVCVNGDRKLRSRALSMGFCQGANVVVKHASNNHGSLLLSINGICIGISYYMAQNVILSLSN